jgi:predicted enzyme related to lactoylglutathione lyase
MEMTSYEPGTPSWVDLGATDPAAAAEFYRTLFGWDVMDLGEEAGGYRMAELRGKPVAGIGQQMQEGMPPWWTTYVSVADVDVTTEAVRKAGGQVFVEPMDVMTAGRMAVFADSTGAHISAWQPGDHLGAGLVNEPGALCWNELVTRQPDEAKGFYADIFGWTAASQTSGPVAYTEWKLDDRTIAGMMPMGENFPPQVPSHWMVYFAVEDTDASTAKVESLGGVVVMPPTDIPPGRFSIVRDPQGATFSLIRMNTPPSAG